MINNLIQAYRAKFYDLSPSDFWAIIKSKWRILLASLIVLVVIFVLLIVSLCNRLPLLIYLSMIFEFVLCIVADRYVVKQYQGALRSEAMHLEKVKAFLETVYPEQSLFSAAKIDTLIERLNEHVSKLEPFKSFVGKLIAFSKSIILPVFSYIAGIYSSNLETLEFSYVVGIAITIIAILAMMYIIWLFVSSALRKVICRDYDAALALHEDLRDMKLIYFSDSSIPIQN